MDDQYVTFQKFKTEEEADGLSVFLNDNGIEAFVENTSPAFDVFFTDNKLANEYRVKIAQADFEAADRLMMENAEETLSETEGDHYLFKFTDGELMEIIDKPDEWSRPDYVLALQLLKDRGKEINPLTASIMKNKRIEQLAQPEKDTGLLIAFGYFFAFLGGFIGMVIGWLMLNHKKTLPNGEIVHAYSEKDRNHGLQILVLGIAAFIGWGVIYYLKTQ